MKQLTSTHTEKEDDTLKQEKLVAYLKWSNLFSKLTRELLDAIGN